MRAVHRSVGALALTAAVGCIERVDLGEPGIGSAPRTFDAGTSEDLLAVHACSPDDVWVAGTLGTVLRVGPAGVLRVPTSVRYDLHAVVCERPDRVWVAGDADTILSYSGSRWTSWRSGLSLDHVALALHAGAVWLLPEGSAYVDGEFTAVAFRYRDEAWARTLRRGDVVDHSTQLVSGRAGLFIFGDDSVYYQWVGDAWATRPIPLSQASSYDLNAAAVSEDAAFVGGTNDDFEPVVLRVGATWDVVATEGLDRAPVAMTHVPGLVVIATADGRVSTLDDAGALRQVAQTRPGIRAMTASSEEVWIVGDDGLLVALPYAAR
jgi:hypothetical protein